MRSPIEILSVSSEVTVSARCDGEKIELIIAGDSVVLLKEISVEYSLILARELVGFALQIVERKKND